MRRLVRDRRQAEAYFVLALTALVLVWLVVQYGAWALVQPAPTEEPGGGLALTFWAVQIGSLAGLLLVGACGLKPAATITCASDGLHIEQGRRALRLPYDAITSVERITALRFHRHERRYAATQLFAARVGRGDLLLLRTARGPVVLGLAPDDQDALCAHLERQARAPASSASPRLAETHLP